MSVLVPVGVDDLPKEWLWVSAVSLPVALAIVLTGAYFFGDAQERLGQTGDLSEFVNDPKEALRFVRLLLAGSPASVWRSSRLQPGSISSSSNTPWCSDGAPLAGHMSRA